MNKNRPKGVVGQWYTMTSDFDGWGETEDREAGYTWKCEEVHGRGVPKIDGVMIGVNETYRLATPEEIAIARGEEKPKTKPSKEARDFWERAFLSFSQEHNLTKAHCLEMADRAMAEWQKRFE